MPTASKRQKLTITIDDPELVEIIREITADRQLPAAEGVARLLRRGLDALEDEHDLAAYREAKDDPTVPWEQIGAEIRAAESKNSAA
ncbi:MAG: hypothetical protein M1358_15595 [Chloroflexi bacterium]|nr:hypothetical protein [Chloroflexota bacterium]